MIIDSLESLRSLYAPAGERSVRKQLARLEKHALRFIGLSPFVVLASRGADGSLDASPRGGVPGFVQVLDETTLLIPDSPGNNRLDTLENVIATGRLGLLFLVPGVDETLRINGTALLNTEPALLDRCSDARRRPTLVIRVKVQEAYLHCAKAFMRSKLWDPASLVDRATLPSMGEMMKDQIGLTTPAETQAEMLVRYAADL